MAFSPYFIEISAEIQHIPLARGDDVMPTDTGEASLPVVLGALRETLVQKRALLGFLVNNYDENGPEGFQASEQSVRLAWRVRHLTIAAEWFEQLLPFEAQFHAVRRHQTLVGLLAFRPVRSTDIFDGRSLLIRAKGTLDMGDTVNIDLAGMGYTRFAQVARPEVIGIEV
jgi:hypothetical protein